MTPRDHLLDLPAAFRRGAQRGVTSVCSAHPLVIEAALIEARETGLPPVIEATCNQVNQEGGYTGQTPQAFRDMVLGIAGRVGVPTGEILFGGDHLGPNPWTRLPAEGAMARAEEMVRDYARAGYGKIHLDASMACADDPAPLSPRVISDRAARLARAAEAGAAEGGQEPPAYIIGTEVPVPGGATEAALAVHVTEPADAAETLTLHADAFKALGLPEVMARCVGLVVQPGVEFGQIDIHRYNRPAARALSQWRDGRPVVFEAHSTDYQSGAALGHLVADGFAILKVGPGLTFALREALYGLDAIAAEIVPDHAPGSLRATMDAVMLANPDRWKPYVSGAASDQRLQRHFGLSDRIRYLWPAPEAEAAVARLLQALHGVDLPWSLISQHLGRLADPVAEGRLVPQARPLLLAAIRQALAPYSAACLGGGRAA